MDNGTNPTKKAAGVVSLTEELLCHPFSQQDFLEAGESAPGLSLEMLQMIGEQFQTQFGYLLPTDYLAFLHHYNGCAEDEDCFLAGVSCLSSTPFEDLFQLNRGKKRTEDGEYTVRLGKYDQTIYVYRPSAGIYEARCKTEVEAEFKTIWEVLEDMNFLV